MPYGKHTRNGDIEQQHNGKICVERMEEHTRSKNYCGDGKNGREDSCAGYESKARRRTDIFLVFYFLTFCFLPFTTFITFRAFLAFQTSNISQADSLLCHFDPCRIIWHEKVKFFTTAETKKLFSAFSHHRALKMGKQINLSTSKSVLRNWISATNKFSSSSI